ncbi:MAG: phosphatase PAP2 family protein [Actinomycetota bacterium]|nr:phosphatase PAP2 family protein [Actinomycetota bacterium]
MDARLAESLNRWFAATSFRADLSRALAIVPLALIGVLVVFAWSRSPSNSPIRRSELLLGVVAAVAALLLNLALGHLYYRARPFLVLDVRPLLPEAVDSSLFSDHLAVAGAAVAALFATRRTFGWIALGVAALITIGRVGAGVQYPSDCLVGVAVGAGCFLVLLPLRAPVSRAIAAAYPGTGDPESKPEHAFTHRHRRGIAIALAFLLFGVGYAIRAIQDLGWRSAAIRAEAMLHASSEPAPPSDFATVPIQTIAAGESRATYATVVGDVTQVSHELDGDYHIRIQGQDAFLVLEIMPEFPLAPPHVGEQITAWGVVRHDGLHNWWELHPLLGWQPGNVAAPPGTGTGGSD